MGADKLWADVAGRPLLAWTLDAVLAAELFDALVVVAAEEAWPRIRALAAAHADVRTVAGGARRQDSVRAGLAACAEAEIVCVHDAARPVAAPSLFHAAVEAARASGAATTAIPMIDSVKRVDARGDVVATLDRSDLVAVQTPQAFRAELLAAAHERALHDGAVADDDAALVERLGATVRVVAGARENVKVTVPADLAVVRALLQPAAAADGVA